MDKRKLAKIAKAEAGAEMIDIAKRLSNYSYIVTAELVCDKKILLLTFFGTETLKKGETGAEFRTFFSETDYITQDLTVSNTKWRTGSFANGNRHLREYDYNAHRFRDNVFMFSEKDGNLIQNLFKDYAPDPPDNESFLSAIYNFQQAVMNNRLRERHKDECAEIDAIMNTVKGVPWEFYKWISDEATGFSRYLIYKDIKRNTAECECTHCKGKITVDRRKVILKNNAEGICPMCGSKVIYKAKGKLPCGFSDSIWTAYVDRTKNGFLLRFFYTSRRFVKENMLMTDDDTREFFRSYVSFENGEVNSSDYIYDNYKNTNTLRWCRDKGGKFRNWRAVLYPDNLPYAWEHTPMRYSAYEILSKETGYQAFHIYKAISEFLQYPKTEHLIKLGLFNLAAENINSYYNTFARTLYKQNGKTIYEYLNLDKINTRTLIKANGRNKSLRLLQTAQSRGIRLSAEKLKFLEDNFEDNGEQLLLRVKQGATLDRIIKYLTKESRWLGEINDTAGLWLDYLNMAEEIGYDLSRRISYFPTKIENVHNRVTEEWKSVWRSREEEAIKKREVFFKARVEDMNKTMGFLKLDKKARDSDLTIIAPETSADIRAEGEALRHCVGSYADKVAKGKTFIFFVRKKDNLSESFYTLEYRDGKAAQCRGLKNCSMTEDVEDFVNRFVTALAKAESLRHSAAERKVS